MQLFACYGSRCLELQARRLCRSGNALHHEGIAETSLRERKTRGKGLLRVITHVVAYLFIDLRAANKSAESRKDAISLALGNYCIVSSLIFGNGTGCATSARSSAALAAFRFEQA